ncbi:hypothetical protein [Nocardia wallacei]|uniref:hypothetical protein n=1 Tax=Nocardia wallacei TaxID=480035 RepID=UPI0024546992|nr:hypothetical protein [Nocardia wallacei]
MPITSPGWARCLDVLRRAPEDSFEHRLGDELAAADRDQALAVLVTIIDEDPYGTTEYSTAAHMLRHWSEATS